MWQPIATAPTEGEILVWDGAMWMAQMDGEENGERWCSLSQDEPFVRLSRFTLWHPLPASPKTPKAPGCGGDGKNGGLSSGGNGGDGDGKPKPDIRGRRPT